MSIAGPELRRRRLRLDEYVERLLIFSDDMRSTIFKAISMQLLLSKGIPEARYQLPRITFGRHTRPQIFNNLKHLLTQRKMELLDRPELLQQLRALEELRAHDGSIEVRPGYGNDDLACVLALCAFELSQNRPVTWPDNYWPDVTIPGMLGYRP